MSLIAIEPGEEIDYETPKEREQIKNAYIDYFNSNRAETFPVSELNNPSKTWWGCGCRFLEGQELRVPSDAKSNIIKGEAFFILCPQYRSKKRNKNDAPKTNAALTLSEREHAVVLNFESKGGDSLLLQENRRKYFYYLLARITANSKRFRNVWVQDKPSGKGKKEGRRMLKIFIGGGFAGAGPVAYNKWMELIDEVYQFVKETIPTQKELDQAIVPSYTKEGEDLSHFLISDHAISDRLQQNKAETMTENESEIQAHNCIWSGAPGTGKSHDLNQKAKEQFKKRITRVTFHPEYTYFDFVGTYRPRMVKEGEKKTIEYAFVPGPFAKVLKRALWDSGNDYCLIIEEINRANVAAVFGDVFQLLDRAAENSDDVDQHESEYAICPSDELRDYLLEDDELLKEILSAANKAAEQPASPQAAKNIILQNEAKRQELSTKLKNELRLPSNLYLWATMNSADQGCFPMDTAFKRRWSFRNRDINSGAEKDLWNNIRTAINEQLLEWGVQEDKLMGYYFLKKEERQETGLETALKDKVMLYLFEDAAKPFKNRLFKEGLKTLASLRDHLCLYEPEQKEEDKEPKKKKLSPTLGVFSQNLPLQDEEWPPKQQ